MPELPEVETVCRGLEKGLKGKHMIKVEQHRADMRTVLPKNMVARLTGQKVYDVARRAKYIQIFLDGGDVLLLHLGMSGRLLITPGAIEAGKHDHLVFHFDDGTCVRFNDPRRFGSADVVAADELPKHKWLKHLGIEPLGKDLTPAWLAQKFKGKKTSIKTAIMDQRLIVGVGNIYAAEALFQAKISPKRKAGNCKPEQLKALVPAMRKVLNASIAAGGSSLRDYRQTSGELGYFQHNFAVYGREGKKCSRCSAVIQRINQGGRSTFYCKSCQV